MRLFSLVRQQRRTYWIGAAIGAAGAIGSALLGRSHSSGPSIEETTQAQKELFDYKFNRELEAMNSAHQREVTDLRAAGLNPILSATGGTGLSAPSGAMPDISSVNTATVTARQANRQLIANTMMNLADIAVRKEANAIQNKSADASLMEAFANLKNANTNSINTASMVQNRNVQNQKLTTEQKKMQFEMNLINSNIALNSARQQEALTNAYIQKALLPSNISKNYSSGGTTGWINRNLNEAEDWLNARWNSAKDYFFGKSK